VAALVLAASALIVGCTCTKPGCGFGITAPKEGETLPPGDVDVTFSALEGSFCTFPAQAYLVTLDGGTPVRVERAGLLKARFSGVGPGSHTARATALGESDRALAAAAVTFQVVAPPAPTPVPTPVPPPPAETPAPPVEEGAEAWSRYLKDVFFDFDKFDIRPDQRDALAEDADWLKKHPMVKFTIEGHCDERGTRQYNLALGERRAHSAKEYLVTLGIEESRISTISYGKDRPFDPGHDESAWAKNRRAHFVVTSTK